MSNRAKLSFKINKVAFKRQYADLSRQQLIANGIPEARVKRLSQRAAIMMATNQINSFLGI